MEISIGWKAIACKMIWSQIIAFWNPQQLLWHKPESLLAPARIGVPQQHACNPESHHSWTPSSRWAAPPHNCLLLSWCQGKAEKENKNLYVFFFLKKKQKPIPKVKQDREAPRFMSHPRFYLHAAQSFLCVCMCVCVDGTSMCQPCTSQCRHVNWRNERR